MRRIILELDGEALEAVEAIVFAAREADPQAAVSRTEALREALVTAARALPKPARRPLKRS